MFKNPKYDINLLTGTLLPRIHVEYPMASSSEIGPLMVINGVAGPVVVVLPRQS